MCPSCKSPDVRRSRTRKLRDRLMNWMGLMPYRCRECNRRFYLNNFEDEKLRREQNRARDRFANASAASSEPGELNSVL